MNWSRCTSSLTVAALGIMMAACSGSPSEPTAEGAGPPDLVAAPSVEFNTLHEDDGTVFLRFSSILVNVGDGDFLLRAIRDEGVWSVEQVVTHPDDGDQEFATDAEMVWGGDGHDHWHIAGVAHYWIVALDSSGNPVEDDRSRADTKVGFCFFDHIRELDHGPDEALFTVHDCGHEDDQSIHMGMSPGWSDKYLWNLPGQLIDITDLEDGMYRLWAEADPSGIFFEKTRDNNLTWVDFELTTLDDGRRGALAMSTGPTPEELRD